MKTKKTLYVIIFAQVLCILTAFSKELFHPTIYALSDSGDGLKNYFTFYSYILNKTNYHLSEFTQMNYPFGEINLYTDNTPLLSIPLKLISRMGVDFTNSAFLIHHLFFISGFLISSILLYFILKRFIESEWLIIVASITLPWISPQFFRISSHFALSFSAVFLWMILLLIKHFETILQKDRKTEYYLICVQILTLLLSVFIHLYYLPALSIAILSFWFFYLIFERNKVAFRSFAYAIFIVVISFVLFFILLHYIDIYKDIREPGAKGYDWLPWKLRWENLFYKYPHMVVSFPFTYKTNLGIETYAYLGSFALYGAVLIPAFFIRRNIKDWTRHRYLLFLLLSSSVLLIIAFGEQIPIESSNKTFTNFLNPFFYIHQFSPIVTQFRCLGRFGWMFFWMFNLIILYFLDQLLIQYSYNRFLKFFLNAILLLAIIDAVNNIQARKSDICYNMLTNPDKMQEMIKLTKGIDFSKYQAILPIPYYHVGYENYDFIIDPDEEQCTHTFQLSLLTKLPLMSSKLSRTPGIISKNLFDIFTKEDIPEYVKKRMNNKPILVYIDWEKLHSGYKPTNTNALNIYNQFIPFLERNEFKLVARYNQFQLCEWVGKKNDNSGK